LTSLSGCRFLGRESSPARDDLGFAPIKAPVESVLRSQHAAASDVQRMLPVATVRPFLPAFLLEK